MEERYEYYLECRYDSRKSFYKKARVRVYENDDIEHLELISYNTLVANCVNYKKENRIVCEYFGCYSQTTTRHQKEFFKQVGLFDRQIKELWLKERLEIRDSDENK